MRIGLTFRIYLYSIVACLAAVAVVHAVAFNLRSEHREDLIVASAHLARSVWLDHRRSEAGRDTTTPVAASSRAVFTFYGASGRVISSTAEPPFPALSASERTELREGGSVELGHGLIAHEVRESGHVVGVAIVRLRAYPSLWSLAMPLLALLVTLLAMAALFSRHLARPLQEVTSVARKLGQGNLNARVGTVRRDEIGELGRAFDTMADRIARLMAAQQELMANVSHELRTPLSRVQVAVDLITDGKTAQVDELMRDVAQDLTELDSLLDAVMTVSKLDLARSAGSASILPIDLESVSVHTLIDDAAARLRARHPGRALSVDVDPAVPEISADRILVRRVLDNLLENAQKFSDDDTTIHLSAERANGGVAISVTDEGIGLAPADVRQAFTPFFRSDHSRSRSTGGTGLGLAIAHRVVEAHGGTIAISSELGEGTTVTLVLPGGAS